MHFPAGFSFCATQNVKSRAEESIKKKNTYLPILHALNLRLSLELDNIIPTSKEGIRMARDKAKFLFPITQGSIPVLLVFSSP